MKEQNSCCKRTSNHTQIVANISIKGLDEVLKKITVLEEKISEVREALSDLTSEWKNIEFEIKF